MVFLDNQNREHRGSRAGCRHVRHLRLSAVCQWKRADLCDAGLYIYILFCIFKRSKMFLIRVRPRPPAAATSTCTPTRGPGCTRSTWTCTSTASPGTSQSASTPTPHSSQLQTPNVSFYSTSRTATFSGLLWSRTIWRGVKVRLTNRCMLSGSHCLLLAGKDEKDCMFEQTGLGLFIFDENKLIAVHDYERSFPAVLDIYKFWWEGTFLCSINRHQVSTASSIISYKWINISQVIRRETGEMDVFLF